MHQQGYIHGWVLFFLPAWSILLPRLLGLDGIPRAELAKLLSLLEGIIARLSPATVPALHWQCRLLVAETLIHLGPACFSLAPATFWDRVYLQPLRCLLQFSGPSLDRKHEGTLDIEASGDHLDEVRTSKCPSAVEDFGPSHVTARAACLIYWLLHGISPFNLEPLDYDFFESDEMLRTLSRMLPLTLQQHFNTPADLCTFLIRQCMPWLPTYCEARCRCSALLGHYSSLYERSSQAESHYFEALFVLSSCPALADDSPCASEFAQSLLERYAETLRHGAKYRYAVAALSAAADAFRKRLGHESNLLLQRISELALSEQDYVRAIQANIALLRTICLEGQLLQAIHVTLRLGHILVEAGWFIRAEQLLTAVWQALEDAAPGLTKAVIVPTTVLASGKLPGSSALMDREQRSETHLSTLIHPSERPEQSALGNVVDPRNHASTSAPVSMRTERRTVECHLSDILLLLSDVRVRAGHAESALQPLFQLQYLLPPRRQAIIDRKLADIWLRLGNTAACRQAYLRYLAKSWSSSVGVSVAPTGVSSSTPTEDFTRAPEEIWVDQPSSGCEWHQALDTYSSPGPKPSAGPKPEGNVHCASRMSASSAMSVDPLLCPSSHGVVRSRPPPEATILALLYEERYMDALEEIDCATEMTNSRRLRNLARLMHLRGQVLCEIACRLECTHSVPSTSSLKHVFMEPRERLCPSRLHLIPPMKLLRQLPDTMQRVWKRWIARLAQRPDVEPPTVLDVVVSARRSFDAAAHLYSVMADEIYAAISTVSALRTDVEWAFRRLVRADSSIEQTRAARSESSNDAWTGNELDLELCEERLIEAASVFMETNLVQASMEVSVTMAQLMLLRRYPDAGIAFLREAWATFYSLYVDARTARFAFSGMASPMLVKELRQLLNRMVLVLYCLPSRMCLEMQLLLDVHNQLVLETVLAESRHATRANLSSRDSASDERYRWQQRSAENGVASCTSTGLRIDRSRPRPATVDALNRPHPSAEDELHASSRHDALNSAGSGSAKGLHALHDVIDSGVAPAVTTEPSSGQKPARRNRLTSLWLRSTGALRRLKPSALFRGERSLGMTSKRLERTRTASHASGDTRLNEAATQNKQDASRLHQRSTKELPIRTPQPGCQTNMEADAAKRASPESERPSLESAEKRAHQQQYSTFGLLIAGSDSTATPAPVETNCVLLPHRERIKSSANTNDKRRTSGTATISSDQQSLAESAALGALFEQACARIVRDVLDDTRRSETAQLCALLQQLDWHEANSPNALNELFGSDDPVQVAWSMQQRFEMQTERYRRGEVSTSELARYNEESLEIWLHEMGKLRERMPTTGAGPIKMKTEAAANATTIPATSTWTSFPSELSSASITSAAMSSSGTPEATTMLALQAIAPDMLYVCNVGGLVCVYNLLNGFRHLFAWASGQATASDNDTSQDGFCLVPQSFALGGVPGSMSSETAPLGRLQRLEGHSALFLPIAIDQTPWLVTGQTVACAASCLDQPQRSWHSSDIASLLGIQRDQWLSCGPQRYRRERSLGLLLCDPTLYLVPWELLLEAPLMRACSLQDYLERQRYIHCDVSDISQIVMFHLERNESESSPLHSPAADGAPAHSVPTLAPNTMTASLSDTSTHTAVCRSRVTLPACCATDWASERAHSSDSSDRLEATFAKQVSTVASGAYRPPESTSVRANLSLASPPNSRTAVVATSLATDSLEATNRPSAGVSVPVSLLNATKAEQFERSMQTRGRVVASAETSAKPPTPMEDSSIRPMVQVLPVSCMEPSQRGSLVGEHTQVRPETSLYGHERPCLPPGGSGGGGSCSSLVPAHDTSRLLRPLTESGERLWSSARALLARRSSSNSVPAQVRSGSALLAGTCLGKLTSGEHAESRLGSSTAFGRLPQTHNSGSGASRAAVDTITAICLFPYHDLAQPGRILLEMRALCPNTIVVFVPIRQMEWFKAAMIGALRYRNHTGQARSVQELIHALLMSCLHQQVPVAFMHGTLEH
ncbi:hypothetical protein F1559_000666 [Cyanidiococcus yangmingshanensis]|uniref:Uncharacterized protein n=1 Tax=Cyanidiococcus yangmingshanensis TaxID=2690220 RepID=A0A7J7IGX7_9RHOD|nr:hypothetical protein F1559_000666 [Cyanidiococcus yangmingshanensis]